MITRAVSDKYAVDTEAEGVVIEKVAIRPIQDSDPGAVSADGGSLTVKDCDVRGQANVEKGAKLLLQKCTIRDCTEVAVSVEGIVVVQDCIIQDSPETFGIQVEPTGEVTVTGTTIRQCEVGLFVGDKATIGKGCSIAACTLSGVYAFKKQVEGYFGEVTVEDDAELVCEGNSTSNAASQGDFLSVRSAPITGVAAENITSVDAHLA